MIFRRKPKPVPNSLEDVEARISKLERFLAMRSTK